MSSRGKGRKFMGGVGARVRIPLHQDGERCSASSMLPFTLTMHTTGAHRLLIAAAGNKGGEVGGGSLFARFACTLFSGVCRFLHANFVCAVQPRCTLQEA